MTKLVPFPVEEDETIKNLDLPPLDLPPDARMNIRRLAAIMHTAEQLQVHMAAQKRNATTMPPMEKISVFFFVHCFQLGRSIESLARLGYGPPCLILVRALMEATVDLSYLWLCKMIPDAGEAERDAWASYSDKAFYQIVEMWNEMLANRRAMGLPELAPLVDDTQATALAKGAAEFTAKFGKRPGWAAPKLDNVLSRARAIDRTGKLRELAGSTLEDDYITVYKYTSQYVHAGVGASNAYIRRTDREFTVDFCPTTSFVAMSAAMAARFMIDLLAAVNHLGHWGFDLEGQFEASGFPLDTHPAD